MREQPPIARSSLPTLGLPACRLLLGAGSFPLPTAPFLSVSGCFLSFLGRSLLFNWTSVGDYGWMLPTLVLLSIWPWEEDQEKSACSPPLSPAPCPSFWPIWLSAHLQRTHFSLEFSSSRVFCIYHSLHIPQRSMLLILVFLLLPWNRRTFISFHIRSK